MLSSASENVTSIIWTPYNKIDSIVTTTNKMGYAYDATGNRVRASVYNSSNVHQHTTWYVRDPQGNVLSIYRKEGTGDIKLHEVPLYGSSREGMIRPNLTWSSSAKDTIDAEFHRYSDQRVYELKDHLGNIRATIGDEVEQVSANEYLPIIKTRSDYYPFGMTMEGRTESLAGYRYGYNGKEMDNDVKGEGNQLDYGARIYDPRIGKWLSSDPEQTLFPAISPYTFALNNPVSIIDPDGGLVLFINGQHDKQTPPGSPYWRGVDLKIMSQFGDHSAHYKDGSLGGFATTLTGLSEKRTNLYANNRMRAGINTGYIDAKEIISRLQRDPNNPNKITESIKVVAHSMGVAYARGYVDGIKSWVDIHNLCHPNDKIEGLEFETELDIAAFQGSHLPANVLVNQTFFMSGDADVVANQGKTNGVKDASVKAVTSILSASSDIPNATRIPTDPGTTHDVTDYGKDKYLKKLPQSSKNPTLILPEPKMKAIESVSTSVTPTVVKEPK